ncbi:FMN-binding negative transcriptional regulator [Agarivorans aestuarii]|uniref:FMN-binding negative transcriptional regulator n=1 Tax=Agarivorans aestuarii TaxID=1563703 RepID=A0ABU7GA21_9ALTE|nr:FMN-binding negative transcriptional regulator [Agarivorans aestuarii]MEE1676237.1 FMN-binding negative transcriptional regulator [Agarivorans aestuarii]
MHIPKHFKQDDWREVSRLIQQYPLACISTHSEQGLVADHVPLILAKNADHQWCLQGHIARINPLAKRLAAPLAGLAVFQGEDAYVSPNYYPSKQSNPKVVPTWNYQVVHVNGTLHKRDELDWKLSLLQRLTEQNEQAQAKPWQVSDAPDKFIEQLNKAIVGFEISIDSWQAQFKQSQNHSLENQLGVAKGLADKKPLMAQQIERFVQSQASNSRGDND